MHLSSPRDNARTTSDAKQSKYKLPGCLHPREFFICLCFIARQRDMSKTRSVCEWHRGIRMPRQRGMRSIPSLSAWRIYSATARHEQDAKRLRMTSHSYPERTLWESMQRRSERGNRVPSVDTFVLLSEFFGVKLDYLVLGKAH